MLRLSCKDLKINGIYEVESSLPVISITKHIKCLCDDDNDGSVGKAILYELKYE